MKICEMAKERHILREKEILNSLKHFNIIELFTTFKDDEQLYFVFEIGQNGTLDQLIKTLKRDLNEPIIQLMFAQMVNVVEYLQTKEIMHRDLKPQNIMLDDNYNIKVIDFGDARRVNEDPIEDEEPVNGS